MKTIRVAVVQMNALLGQTRKNLAVIERFTRAAAKKKVDLILFPELALQGHWVSNEVYAKAEPVPEGPSVKRMEKLARQLRIYVSFGMAALQDNAVYNAQVLVGPKGYLGTSCKLHLSGDERLSYRGGNSIPVFDIGKCKIGQVVCYDNLFPEVARILAIKGADVILMPHAGRCGPWTTLSQEKKLAREAKDSFKGDYSLRAKENATFCVVANQAGRAGCVDLYPKDHPWQPNHAGGMVILSPSGEVLAESKSERIAEEMVITDLDPALLDKARGNHNSTLANRRPELFSELVKPASSPVVSTSMKPGRSSLKFV